MPTINNFPIETKTFEDLDLITNDQSSPLDKVLVYDESDGVVKAQTLAERDKAKVIPLDNISDFISINYSQLSNRQQFHLNSFAPGGVIGGGPLLWAPDLPKSLHDGVKYFSPTVPVPSDFNNPTQVQNYMDGVGEEFPTEDGVFALTLYSIASSESPVTDGQLVAFNGPSGNSVKKGPTPTESGVNLIELAAPNETSFAQFNDDGSVSLRTVAQLKTDLSLPENTANSIAGKVSGPDSSAADQIALFDGITGKLLKAGQNLTEIFNGWLFDLYSYFPRTLNTYADISTTPLLVGQIIRTKGHTIDGVGSLSFIGASGSVTDNGGTERNSATPGVHAKAIIDDHVTPQMFGAIENGADCTLALNSLVSFLNTFSGTTRVPTVSFKEGTYTYSASPNWAIKNLTIECTRGVFFQCTGSGSAFIIDGGATGPGISGFSLVGFPTIKGNASTQDALYVRGVHRSNIEACPRDCARYGTNAIWCVTTNFKLKTSPLGEPSMSPQPLHGLYLDQRGEGERTSNCTFDTPIMEGVSGYGIYVNNGVVNTFIGGASESNGGGIFVGSESAYNTFINTDLEFQPIGIFSQGSYNNYIGILDDSESTFSGVCDSVVSGIYNKITCGGSKNSFSKVNYAAAGGVFTDTGTGTVKRSVLNVTTGILDVDKDPNPKSLVYINGPVGNNTVIGSNDQLAGGSANDVNFYHFGAGEIIISLNGISNIRMKQNQIGFYGTDPISKPSVSGVKDGNEALASLISALSSLGLITDSTT